MSVNVRTNVFSLDEVRQTLQRMSFSNKYTQVCRSVPSRTTMIVQEDFSLTVVGPFVVDGTAQIDGALAIL
jgi:hypothetical protein